jgi:hypothetical protein
VARSNTRPLKALTLLTAPKASSLGAAPPIGVSLAAVSPLRLLEGLASIGTTLYAPAVRLLAAIQSRSHEGAEQVCSKE